MLGGRLDALLLNSQEDVFFTLLLNPTYRASNCLYQMIFYLIHQCFTGYLVRWRSCPFGCFFSLSAWNPDKNKDLTFLVRYTEVLPLTNAHEVLKAGPQTFVSRHRQSNFTWREDSFCTRCQEVCVNRLWIYAWAELCRHTLKTFLCVLNIISGSGGALHLKSKNE